MNNEFNYAVIDMGTVKIKSLIASISPTRELVQKYFSNTLTCFGCEMDKNDGYVRDDHLAKTIEELKRVKAVMKKFDVKRYKVVSTHAMRRAKNRQKIMDLIKKELGFEVEDISHQQEAELFFQAVMKTFDTGKDYAVVDMGGGSVQILIGNSKKLKKIHMMQTGSEYLHTNFTEDCRNPLSSTTPENLVEMKKYILEHLSSLKITEDLPLIYGSSNIIDLMKFIKLPLEAHTDSKMHPYKVQLSDLRKFMEELLPLTYEEREKRYPFQKGYMYGVDKAFLNITTIADYLHSPYIIPTNANIAQGLIYSLLR